MDLCDIKYKAFKLFQIVKFSNDCCPKVVMRCLLCKGTVKSLDRYKNHLNEEHELSYGSDILIAVTFLNEAEKGVLTARVEQRKRQFVEEKIFNITGNIFTNTVTDESNDETVSDKLCNIEQSTNGISTQTENLLQIHTERNYSSKDSRSQKCQEQIVVMENNNHTELKGDDESKYQLSSYRTVINTDILEELDIKYELNKFAHKCNYCDKHFPTVGSVKNHMKRKHSFLEREGRSSINQKFPDEGKHCKLCVLNFNSVVGLKIHKKKVHLMYQSVNFGDTSCKYCKKVFKAGSNRKRNMKKHMNIVHNITGSDIEVSGGDQNIKKNFLALLNANKNG